MKLSERELLKGLDNQLHNTFISEEDYKKIDERLAQERKWEEDRLKRQAQEEAKRKMYQRGEMPANDRAKFDEGMREFVKTISADIEAQKKKEAAEWAKFDNYINSQKERDQIERLLEIAENKALSINAQIAAAEGNEALLEELKHEKADIESDIKFYKTKYESLKNLG